MGSVENPVFPQTCAVLAVEPFVDNSLGLSRLFHTLHTLHNMHIASTIEVHKLWIMWGLLFERNFSGKMDKNRCRTRLFQKRMAYAILFFTSSSTEAKELSLSIISSTRLQALMAVV